MYSSTLFGFLSLLLIGARAQSVSCNDEDECYGDSLTGDNIYCYGYQGCYNADITASASTYCYGYQGCYYADVDSSSYTWCDGMYGCAYGTVKSGTISCSGRYGCYRSDLQTTSSSISCGSDSSCSYSNIVESDDVYCYGYFGCSYSSIMKSTRIYAFSYYALYGSDIVVSQNNQGYVYALGYYATRYADVWCYDGSTCQVTCDSYGCYDISIYCYDGATCSYTCDEDCDYCPEITYSSSYSRRCCIYTIKRK